MSRLVQNGSMISSSIHGRQRSLAKTIASATGKPMMRQSRVVSPATKTDLAKMPR